MNYAVLGTEHIARREADEGRRQNSSLQTALLGHPFMRTETPGCYQSRHKPALAAGRRASWRRRLRRIWTGASWRRRLRHGASWRRRLRRCGRTEAYEGNIHTKIPRVGGGKRRGQHR
jgi:hypothetical protein